ncbi:MAG: hypothetical protein Q7V62_14655, partial [Actinomycetota bacterium]|nr:hypothetical protein [Actinomycetota bacterium]
MSDRWIRGHFGDEVRPRPEFLRPLEAERSLTWPAPAVPPGPEPEPEPEQVQPAEEVDVRAAFQDQSAPAPASTQSPPPASEWPAEVPSAESPAGQRPGRRGA